MTGIEEEILTDNHLVRNGGKLITALLFSVIEEIDGEIPSKEDIRNLTIGDRDAILLELRKISLGAEMVSKFQCPSCKAMIEIVEDLNEIKTKEVEGGTKESMEIELTDGYKDKEGKVHKIAVVKYPTGATQEKSAAIMRQNMGRGNTAMLTECVKEIGKINSITGDIIKNLTKRDRDILLTKISKNAPGPKFTIEVTCYECGHTFETELDLSNFFVSNL